MKSKPIASSALTVANRLAMSEAVSSAIQASTETAFDGPALWQKWGMNQGHKRAVPRVLVAMSGGVDSSVAALRLKLSGADVVGVTMQVWDYSQDVCRTDEGLGTCCSSIDVDDARRVAEALDFPFYVLNCESEFQHRVIDNFVSEYAQGRTPIPCVQCNTFMKFDHLFQKMQELDCDYLATGHYAQKSRSMSGSGSRILTSADSIKDQTYFLFTLDPDRIDKLVFPVGDLTKSAARELAARHGLKVASKKDSTGICFVGKADYADVVEQQLPPEHRRPGVLKEHITGRVLGHHTGIHRFTVGQRKGLGVSSQVPLYVTQIDAGSGDVFLGMDIDLMKTQCRVRAANWLTEPPSIGERLQVKIRFQHRAAWAEIVDARSGDWVLKFLEPQRAITPGQAAVFYRDQELLGGGWISHAEA